MITRHRSFAILVTALILTASFILISTPRAYAQDPTVSVAAYPQEATANSQRWFRTVITWPDDTIIDGVYFNGTFFTLSTKVGGPSGKTYAQALSGNLLSLFDWGAGLDVRLTVVETPTKIYYVSDLPVGAGALAGLTLTITSGLGNGNVYNIVGNGSDDDGTFLTLSGSTPLDPEVCADLEMTDQPSDTRVYYEPIVISEYYPTYSLPGLTLRFTAGEAAGQEFDIVDNGYDGAYYIEIDDDFPAELDQEGTADSIASTTKFYYSGVTFAAGALAGETLVITSGSAEGDEVTISDNDTDGGGDYIETTASWPTGFAAADTFTIKDIMHVCDTATVADPFGLMDRPWYFGVAFDYPDSNTMVVTVGPFCHYYWEWLPGRLPTTSFGPGDNFNFAVHWITEDDEGSVTDSGTVSTKGTHITQNLAIRWPLPPNAEEGYIFDDVIWGSGELPAWYSGEAVGVDPLVTEDSAPGGVTDPDNGSGSDLYTFRIKYFSGYWLWNEIPLQWRGQHFVNQEYHYVDFDYFAHTAIDSYGTAIEHWRKGVWPDDIEGGNLVSRDSWIYNGTSDNRQDRIGDSPILGIGGEMPEAILIVDRVYNEPMFMDRESGTSYDTGIVYRYLHRPTNYLQLLNNIFTLQYDQPGFDAWDTAFTFMTGRPTSNGYVTMRAGGHRYEFLTTRDFDPPVKAIIDEFGAGRKIGPCAVVLRSRPGDALEVIHVVNDYWFDSGQVHTEFIDTWYEDSVSGGYGYPYESQDPDLYPKLDPVLTAHPYFQQPGLLTDPEQGFPTPGQELLDIGPQLRGALDNLFNPLPSTLPPGGEPWGDIIGPTMFVNEGGYGAGQDSALRFTNQDTIMPNYVNIWPDTTPYDPNLSQPSMFRGGKWQTDTTFFFRINYWQSDNLTPTSMQVWIRKTGEDGTPAGDWSRKAMGKVYPADITYNDGVLYYYEIDAADLPGGGGVGDYQYSFRASDGTHIAIYPNRPADDPGSIGVPPGDNDYYWFRVNTAPVLTNESVTPMVSTAAEPPQGDFLWDVTYTDDDGEVRNAGRLGDRPFKSIMWIDLFGDVEGQAVVVSVASNVITYEVDGGSGTPYAAGSLVGLQVLMETGTAEGDQFVITANTVAGPQGTITCTGLSGVAATDQFDIVDWFVTEMDETNPADTNHRDGKQYDIDTARLGFQLTPGAHLYYYEFWDNWAYWIDWQQYFMTSDPDPIDQKVEGEIVRLPATGYLETPYSAPPVPLYSISGTVYDTDGTTPLAGATLKCYDGAFVDPADLVDEQTTGAGGTYEFEDLPDDDYRVIPSYGSEFFDPTEEDVTVSGANETGVDFELIAAYTISGTVYDTDGTTPLEGATLRCYDGAFAHPADLVDEQDSASDGTYEFEGLVDDTYRVIPSYGGYDFDPTQTDVVVSGADETDVDFEMEPGDWSISGTILDTGSNPVEDVTVSTTGGSDETDSSGDYLIGNLPSDDYTLTATAPIGPYYTFAPDGWSQPVTVSGADETDIDFEATEQTFSVSGTVLEPDDDPISGIVVTDGTNSDTTAGDGTYTITGVSAGLVTITAQPGLGLVFVPQNQDVTVPAPGPSNVTDVDFTGYAGVGYSYSAGLHLTGVPLYPIEGYAEDVFLTSSIWWWHPNGTVYIGTGHPNATSLLQVLPAMGFFVNYGSATDINVAGTTVPTGVPFVKLLGPAWNMVANPFDGYRLPMANIQPDTGQVILPFVYIYDSFTGSYLLVTDQPGIGVARSYLNPWEGAWLYACNSNSFTVEMTAGPAVAAAGEEVGPQALDTGQSGWAVPVLAHVGNRSDLMGAIGISSIEPYSLPNPPAALNSVDLYFVGEGGSQLAQSVVSPTGDTVSWEFVVATDIPDSEVEVALPDLSQLPNDLVVTLTDLDTGRAVYARTMPSYSFRGGENGAVRHFRIEVGPQQAGGLAITTATAQPGGSGAVITYGVSQASNVTVEVMNISGQVIKTLAAGEVAAAGTHTLSWNLRSNSGTVVPRGMYLVRIEAAAENGQRTSRLCQLNVNR